MSGLPPSDGRAYYNERDPKAAAWLRELIRAGHVADGDVDERSIEDIQPADLAGFSQCHFFAGIGGWSYGLRLAGWPDARSVWTGSCPCQPFSAAGQQVGGDDPRHLWPAWFRLVKECRPSVLFGEQVEAAITHGWLDLVCDDLEREGYAVGSASLSAASVGAPHLRQRLWFVAQSDCPPPSEGCGTRSSEADGGRSHAGPTGSSVVGLVADASESRQQARQRQELSGPNGHDEGGAIGERGLSPWTDLEWLVCRDGKARPTQPGLCLLAHGVSGRVGLLRGYGNAIVPQVAAAFVMAYMGIPENGESRTDHE